MDVANLLSRFESPAHSLFRRCVQCPSGEPACPACPDGQICSFISYTCDSCAYNVCIKSPNPTPKSQSDNSSPAGPIAGGVIGGIILVSLLVFLVYWFYMRPKKRIMEHQAALKHREQLEQLKEIPTPMRTSFEEQRSKRASTHTVASVKTTGSRASIPIAYIPGVTSRSDANSPDMIPPVPPIPAAGGNAAGTLSPRMNTGTEMFFRPESSYSDINLDHQSNAARSTRGSVVSEHYKDAIVNPMPAQAVYAAKPTPISVKSGSSHYNSQYNSPNRSPTSTPPLSHAGSIASRVRNQGPITGQSGQARQITITRSTSNLRAGAGPGNMNTISELDDTSTGAPTPRLAASELDDTSVGYRTPKIGIDRSGTASPRSMLSDDAEEMMLKDGRWRKPSGTAFDGLRSPDFNNPPVSAAGQSTFSKGSPVSAMGWDPQANIRNTIRDATSLAYGNQFGNYGGGVIKEGGQQQNTGYGGGSQARNGNQPNSPFADLHAAP